MAIPDGMREVSKDEFYRLLNADAALDPMPSPQPDYTLWMTNRTTPRAVWGYSTPGWRATGPKVYAVRV